MNRMWRFTSQASRIFSIPKSISAATTTTTTTFNRHINTLQQQPNPVSGLVSIFTASTSPLPIHITNEITILKNKLILQPSDPVILTTILNDNSKSLTRFPGAFLELLNQLDSKPCLAVEVFNWRRKRDVNKSDALENSMNKVEYSKGIKAAGRSRNIDLAVELFEEAESKGLKATSTYNALMSAFMFNGLAGRCYSLFLDMKKDSTCPPSTVTYNIIITVFGRLMLTDNMEATFKEMNELNLSPNTTSYNYLIGGYVSTWMWDDMERVFQVLKSGPVQPNMKTYKLMIRGYAHSGNLEKMEEIYSLVRDHVNKNEMAVIRAMICAYCKSSDADKIKKVESLLKWIPEKEYRSWLNVLLIKLYAQENSLEAMENAINEAFEHRVSIRTIGIMKCIIAAYFRCNAVENLENFIRRSIVAEWRICRSVYHCKLVVYGKEKKLKEMQNVLMEMKDINMSCNIKTLWIMYKAYSTCGEKSMVLKILGQMFKHGYEIRKDAFPL